MKHGSRRAKARRLQVETAEMLAAAFGLTILAEKPTKPGWRDVRPPFSGAGNRVLWVPEGEPADLKVRVMGQPGADVALLTKKAKEAVAFAGRPLYIEDKNVEAGWDLGRAFWEGRLPAGIAAAWRQASKAATGSRYPLVVLGRNFWPPVAVCNWMAGEWGWLKGRPLVMFGDWYGVAMPFARLIPLLDGARKS